LVLAFKEERSTAHRPGRSSRLLTAALFLLGICFILYTLAPQTLGETARRQFLARLVDHYPAHTVSIRRGHFDPDVGLIFEDIRFTDRSERSATGAARELIRVERMTLVSDVHPEKLLDKQVPLTTKRIVIEGVQANAWIKENGQLCLEDLLPLPKFGPAVPRVDIKRTNIRLSDKEMRSRPVDVELAGVSIRTAIDSGGKSKQQILIQGSADFADALAVRIDHDEQATDVQAKVSRAFLSRDLFDRLPSQWTASFQHGKDLQCVCDAGLVLRRKATGEMVYKLKTTVHQGQFKHPRLPQPITDLRGVLVCDPSGITINASQGVLGDAVVRATGRIDGLKWPCDVALRLSGTGLMLDDRLAASLPPSIQTAWNKLRPYGRVDIVDAELNHQHAKWKVRASIDCNAVDVRYEKFPYPLESLVGRIEINDGIASSKALSGRIGDSRLQCAFTNPIEPGIVAAKSFAIRTDSAILIDNSLLSALTPRGSPTTKLETFVRSIRPRGTVKLDSAVLATDTDGRQSRNIVLQLVNGHVNYEKFAYPLVNVNGKIVVEDDLVSLTGIRASTANAGVVKCEGTYKLPPNATMAQTYHVSDAVTQGPQSELLLNFVATDVSMDPSLRNSLPESTRHVWDSISPSGVLDQLNVQLTQRGFTQPVSLDITAKQDDTDQVTNRTLSLAPVSLPYRLDVSGGTVRFDGTKVTIHSLKGRHDASTLSADGQCVRNANGRWELSLDLHSGSRLHPDMELIEAMPLQVRSAMRGLQLRGPVSVRGRTRILLPDDANPAPDIAWNLGLQLEGNRIGDVGPVHAIRGEIAVRGVQDQDGPRAVGQVRIDSMHVYDLQVTHVEGPFSIHGDQLLLGRQARASSTRGETPNQTLPIEGKLFDGKIELDGKCILSSGNFLVDLSVEQGRVPTALAEFGHGDNTLTGTFQGQTKLQGTLGRMDLLNGSGTARVSGANLYQLPLVVQVLNLLRVTPTEDVAFTDGQMEFAIEGETVRFDDLQIWGDLVALDGGGTLHRMRDVDLTFNTRVSPQNTFTKIVRPLSSNRYTLWTVDVHGPLNALQIERRALDGVGETLERLFPAMADADRAPEQKGRTWFGDWLQ
jgi:hypothetical protein